jgi:F-type H+-transporting ATPase subunit delta
VRRWVRPYARALVGAVDSPQQGVTVRDELAAFQRLLDEVPALGRMAVHPAVPMKEKERTLEMVAEQAKLQPLTRRFLGALLRRHRLQRMGEVVEGVTELLNKELGIAVARVASAADLSQQQQDELARTLEKKLDKQVEIRLEVDPALLAGFVVQVESRRWDGSLKGQLERLTHELAANA